MDCPSCNNPAKLFGKDRKGGQRYRCLSCAKTFGEPKIKILDNMILTDGKALSVLQHLVEGCSVRSTERLTGVHSDTILDLLNVAGVQCEALMLKLICGLKVQDVDCDEIWQYIGMKSRTNAHKQIEDPEVGDCWTLTAIERHSKLILAWHLGQRGYEDTFVFTEKLAYATEGNFQVSTDGFRAYQDAMVYSLGMHHIDFAQVIKIYANNPESETRYRSARCTGVKKHPTDGGPDMDRAGTSRIERQHLSARLENQRFTSLTNGFCMKWANHHAALALYFAYYNFCRMHQTIRCTPAMAQGITKSVWTLKDLLTIATMKERATA